MDFSHNPYAGLGTPHSFNFPDLLTLDDARPVLDALPTSAVLLGVDGEGEPVTVDLDDDSPHILVSAPTGAGKSALARSVAAQRLSLGDRVVFLDKKRHSHRWAKSLAPNVHYASSDIEIAGALVVIGEEVHRRNMLIDQFTGPVPDDLLGPRLIVVYEEMNATMRHLASLQKRRPDGEYGAADALADVSFMGRAVRIHLVSFAQLASYRASGGSEIVENYGTRILIKYSPQAWRYLASDCGKIQSAPSQTGRGMVCFGGKARETQLLLVTEEEAPPFVLGSTAAYELAGRLSAGRAPALWRQAHRRALRSGS